MAHDDKTLLIGVCDFSRKFNGQNKISFACYFKLHQSNGTTFLFLLQFLSWICISCSEGMKLTFLTYLCSHCLGVPRFVTIDIKIQRNRYEPYKSVNNETGDSMYSVLCTILKQQGQRLQLQCCLQCPMVTLSGISRFYLRF